VGYQKMKKFKRLVPTKSTIMTNMSISFLFLVSCASISMNHYQDGKTIGKEKYDINGGLGFGLSYVTDTTKIDEMNYEVETKRGTSTVFANISGQVGVSSRFDMGCEVFSAFGSTGFRLYGKYAFLDSLSTCGVAFMPTIGFAFPWFEQEEDEYEVGTGDVKIAVRSIFIEGILPISYHPSSSVTYIFTPKIYFFHNYMYQIAGSDVDFNRVGEETFIYPGASIGMRIKKLHFELTIIRIDKDEWAPFLGACISLHSVFQNFDEKEDQSVD
jgi:hypothetical protein